MMDRVKNLIATFKDFPQKGVTFRDVLPVFRDPEAYSDLIEELVSRVSSLAPDCSGIVGIEARGFMIACPLALRMKLPFVPVRKPSKLAGKIIEQSYQKEYGKDSLSIQADSVQAGKVYVIVDDVLATGGTMRATQDLLASAGAKVGASIVIVELEGLGGRNFVESCGGTINALFKFTG